MRYLRDKEFRMSVLISACVAAITAAAGFFLIRQQAAMAGFLLAVLGCVLVIALWLAFTLCRYRRLEKLAADTDRMLHGERDLNFTQYREGELEILANELSKLLNRLSEQADHLQAEKVYLSDSLADISHQLRTPLTSLNLVLARLGQETDPQERRKLLYEAGQLQEKSPVNAVSAGMSSFICCSRSSMGMAKGSSTLSMSFCTSTCSCTKTAVPASIREILSKASTSQLMRPWSCPAS